MIRLTDVAPRGLLVLALAAALPSSPRAQEVAPAQVAARPLFASDSVLHLRLRTDLRALLSDRDTARSRYHPATLTLLDPGGAQRELAVEVRTRGNFRLQECAFPPLRVRFGPSAGGTPFDGQDRLKLVTPCRPRASAFQQYVLQEYLLYRVYQLLTPYSFRTRLARIEFDDSAGRVDPVAGYAFFIESDQALAARNGGALISMPGVRGGPIDREQAMLVAVFQYMIANTDWSIGWQHNVRLVQTGTGAVVPVPYDLDWSGLIAPPYAIPDTTLPITRVQERLYRGYCVRAADLRPVLERFTAARPGIYALLDSVPQLDASRRERMRRQLDVFYRIIGSESTLQREIRRGCI